MRRIEILRYTEIARVEAIPKNNMRVVTVKGLKILLVNVDDRFYAVENHCPHMGYSLYLGSIDGTVLTCGFHYAQFDITTGKTLNSIADKPLRTFKLKVEGSRIFAKL